MQLSELLKAIPNSAIYNWNADQDEMVVGVSHNSNLIEPGFVFVARKGATQDSHNFISKAIQKGAVAIVGEEYSKAHGLPVPYIQVSDPRESLADIATAVMENPSRNLTVVGVTGTKGKTTTAWLTHHILKASGYKTGLISTVGYKLADDKLRHFPEHFTTPEAPQVQAVLKEMVLTGCTHAVIEASSHALALKRLRGTKFDVAIWTNLAPEHLDFHIDMENYFLAKRILIDSAPFAILNTEDTWTTRLIDRPHYTYGEGQKADWNTTDVIERVKALQFTVHYPSGNFSAILPLIGRYNILNALGSMAAAFHLGLTESMIQQALITFKGVPGRMQIIQEVPKRVVIDFAHTPSSLENALMALRPTTLHHLIIVIGSAGGKRYPGKRAPIGSIATKYADFAIFTEEDSRETPVEDILSEMKRGADEENRINYILIPDRYQAIMHAIMNSVEGDTIVLAGKGPETTLERFNETLLWDEAEIARSILREFD